MSVTYFPAGFQMTNREQIHLLIAKVGMLTMLQEIVKALGHYLVTHPEEYILKLKEDVQTALKNYEDRYKDE